MKPEQLIERVYELAETQEVDRAVLVCLRLARSMNDTFNAVMFLRELSPDIQQLKRAILDETKHLNAETRSAISKATLERWLHERTVPYLSTNQNDDPNARNVLALGVGELVQDIENMGKWVEDLRLPPGLGEYDTAAFVDRTVRMKGEIRLKVRACQEVLQRIRTRCFNYASRLERQLAAETRTSDIVSAVQREVHNFYAERCDAAFQSLRKAASLIGSTDAEDHAVLLTSVRRAVKAVADYHYPPPSKPVICADGKVRDLGNDEYLNRLHEFCMRQFEASASTSLLRAEFEYPAAFVRRLNEVASKGVHAQVTPLEARQGLLGVYLFLSNLIAKLEA